MSDPKNEYIWEGTISARYILSWRTSYVTLLCALMGHQPSMDLIEFMTRKR